MAVQDHQNWFQCTVLVVRYPILLVKATSAPGSLTANICIPFTVILPAVLVAQLATYSVQHLF